MPVIPINEWVPDAADLGNPGSIVCRNALPGVNSYQPFPSHVPLTNALDAYARGAIITKDKDGNVEAYCGDAGKLYGLTTATWANVSVGGGYSTGSEEVWQFAPWKNKMLATNFSDNPQSITLGGANFANLTTDFKCRHIAVIRDWVIAANTYDAGDGNVPDRVRTSAFNDETAWTVDDTTGAIARDLKVGAINALWGGQYAVLFTRDATFRMDFEGSPTWFRIDETLPGIGTLGPKSSCRIGETIFTWSDSGMFAISRGTAATPIGAGKVNQFLYNDLDDNYLWRISAVADSRNGRVYWAYPGPNNSSGLPNRIVCFDTRLNRWSLIHQDVELLWLSSGVGYTLEGLDAVDSNIDTLTPSLDSSAWKGDGTLLLAAFDSDHKHGFFDGVPMTAVFETKESELNAGNITHLNEFTPLVDGGTVTARVGSRNRLVDSVSYTSSISQSASGRMKSRKGARFHRFELTVSGEWNDVIGVEVDQIGARRMERRG